MIRAVWVALNTLVATLLLGPIMVGGGLLRIRSPRLYDWGGRSWSRWILWASGTPVKVEGAHNIDVGGESTRPPGRDYGEGSDAVPVDEEIERTIPVVPRQAPIDQTGVATATAFPVTIERIAEFAKSSADRGIEIVPLTIRFGEEEFVDRFELGVEVGRVEHDLLAGQPARPVLLDRLAGPQELAGLAVEHCCRSLSWAAAYLRQT